MASRRSPARRQATGFRRRCGVATKRLRDEELKRQPRRSRDRLESNDSREAGSPGGEINIRDFAEVGERAAR
jgi:hypothetical protein